MVNLSKLSPSERGSDVWRTQFECSKHYIFQLFLITRPMSLQILTPQKTLCREHSKSECQFKFLPCLCSLTAYKIIFLFVAVWELWVRVFISCLLICLLPFFNLSVQEFSSLYCLLSQNSLKLIVSLTTNSSLYLLAHLFYLPVCWTCHLHLFQDSSFLLLLLLLSQFCSNLFASTGHMCNFLSSADLTSANVSSFERYSFPLIIAFFILPF